MGKIANMFDISPALIDHASGLDGGGKEGRGKSGGITLSRGGSCKYKKGHMTNVYLTDEEAIVHFEKDCEELYDKTSEYFKDKAMKECLWEQFAKRIKTFRN